MAGKKIHRSPKSQETRQSLNEFIEESDKESLKNIVEEDNAKEDLELARQLQIQEDFELAKKLNDNLPKNLKSFIPREPALDAEYQYEEHEKKIHVKKSHKTRSRISSPKSELPIEVNSENSVIISKEYLDQLMQERADMKERIEKFKHERVIHARRSKKIRQREITLKQKLLCC